MKRIIILLAAAISLAACGPKTQEPSIIAPPEELNLDPFYAKYLNVKGIHLISSPVCSDEAMYAAYKTLTAMTDGVTLLLLRQATPLKNMWMAIQSAAAHSMNLLTCSFHMTTLCT